MLALHVDAPRHRKVELAALGADRLQLLDRVGVVHALEAGAHELLQTLHAGLVHALRHEGHVVGALVQQRGEHVLQQAFGKIGVGGQIGERDLGLDHPELGQMAAGVAVLRAEGWPEGVHLAQRQAPALHIQLSAHGQVRLLAEEVLVEVHLAFGRAWRVHGVQRAHAEHLSGALAVARRDDGRVHPLELALMEELMHRHRQRVSDAAKRTKGVGARSKVRHFAQVLVGMGLRLDGIGVRIVDEAVHLQTCGLQFKCLRLALALHQRAFSLDRAAGGQLHHLLGVVGQRVGNHQLQGGLARSVGQIHEAHTGF